MLDSEVKPEQQWEHRFESLSRDLARVIALLESDARRDQQRLRSEIDRLTALVNRYTAENQELSSRAATSAYEASTFRRQVSDMRQSLSWRITAPLRWISAPLFRSLGGNRPAPAPSPAAPPSATVSDPFEPVLAALRDARSVVAIPCAVPFSATANQRPISCARYLAGEGSTVLYVAWQWSPEEVVPRAFEEVYPGIFHIPLYAFQENAARIAAASHGKGAYLCTLPSPGLVEAAGPLRAGGYHIHYDLMDDWEEFHRGGQAPWFSEAVERELVLSADTVSSVSQALADKFAHLRSDIALVRNGYDPDALACPQFVAAAPRQGPKTVGYFGHLTDAWFDWDAVLDAARALPDVRFELIGYGLSDRTQLRLNDFPNVRFLGLVPQNELHLYAKKWWAGMIPFRATPLSAAVDPLKIYEYLHLGLPAVVTGISGIAGFPLVSYAEDAAGFAAAIAEVNGPPGEAALAGVREFLKECVWQERFAHMHRLMSEPAALAYLYAG